MLQDLDGMLYNPHIALKVLREYGGTDPILSCAVFSGPNIPLILCIGVPTESARSHMRLISAIIIWARQ